VIRRLASSFVLAAGCILAASALLATGASAAEPPQWKLTLTPDADYFIPGPENINAAYTIEAENVGGGATSGQITLEAKLPAGLSASHVSFFYSALGHNDISSTLCPTFVRCVFPGPASLAVQPGQRLIMVVRVSVPAQSSGALLVHAKVSGGGAATVETSATNEATTNPLVGFDSFDATLTDSSGGTYSQAGGHPFQIVTEMNFATQTETKRGDLNVEPFNAPVRDPKDISVDLPPGLIGNPGAVPRCELADFFSKECPLSTAVGTVGVRYEGQVQGGLRELGPLYNLKSAGEFPGMLGFEGAFPYIFTAGVRSGSDYGISITSAGTPEAGINRIRVVTWGVPADPAHDSLRGKTCLMGLQVAPAFEQSAEANELKCANETGLSGEEGSPAGVEETPFLTMPTECSGSPLAIGARFNNWQLPEEFVSTTAPVSAVDGCNALSFAPNVEVKPTTNLADAPSGLDFKLEVPQSEDPEGTATPELKEAVVELPQGLSVNPSSASGLGSCTEDQVGLKSEEAAHCPDASKLGTVLVETSLLREPVTGFLYLATPHQNPFDTLLAGYIVLEGQGLKIKLAGRFETDPQTGQITGKFPENPQLPFEVLKLHLFEGARGDLRTPSNCGTYTTTAVLTPYSAPESGPSSAPTSSFQLDNGGAPCAHQSSEQPNAPVFRAGTESPLAGAFTPFSFKLARDDGSQELSKIDTTLPPGLVGKLAGVGECSEAQLAAAAAPSRSGTEEQAAPSCPANTEVGTVDVGAGAGPTPLYVTGHAYLAGPYKGAPLSLAIITPAVAGPFDLGTVVVRTALYVDPFSAQIHAVSDEIPHILEGIPLDVRSITLQMNRPNFTLNPTNCNELGFTGAATSLLGQVAPLAQRFQVGGCSTLKFKPKLTLKLKGGTRRATFPALTATVKMPPGGANIASAQVTLPHSEQLEQAHINTVCTRPQLASHTCPKGSIYGHARAVTPLLDHPLEGPVYLGVGFGHELPDLVAELGGQITVLLHGKVDTGHEGSLRNTFEVVPDAPVSKFTLSLFGGKKSLVVNSENICGPRAKVKALAKFTAQNGKAIELEPTVRNSCKKKGKGKGGGRKHHRAGRERLPGALGLMGW
jgi:hypothetical protein